jgi:pyruvate formate lyase activating enzyme
VGIHYPVDKLVELLLRDRIFYETSGGGVTFSGGEPTLHMEYLGAALERLKGFGIHTAIQTCGMFDLSDFKKKVLPYLDLIFYDLKIMDPRLHVKYTGKDNRVILQNFTDLMKESPEKVQPRMALVPGITATTDNVKKIAGFLKRVGCADCEALPYNPGGIAKRAVLGDSVPPQVSVSLLTIKEETRWKNLLRNKLD